MGEQAMTFKWTRRRDLVTAITQTSSEIENKRWLVGRAETNTRCVAAVAPRVITMARRGTTHSKECDINVLNSPDEGER
jgi:hypothetical protein